MTLKDLKRGEICKLYNGDVVSIVDDSYGGSSYIVELIKKSEDSRVLYWERDNNIRREATLHYTPVGTSTFHSMSSDTDINIEGIKSEEMRIGENRQYLFPNIKDL